MAVAAETVVCVGSIVLRDESILAVRQAKGHSLEGQWTIPWGRLEVGESPSQAAVREVEEESNLKVEVQGLAGIQEMPEPWSGWIALVFHCRYLGGDPQPDRRETDAARFLSLPDLESLRDPVEPWSLWLMRRVLRAQHVNISVDVSNPYGPSPGFL